MIRAVVTSDWHHDAITGGCRRAAEIETAAMQTVDYAVKNKVDLFVNMGDLTDPDTERSHAAVAFAVKVSLKLANVHIAQVWLGGNHDDSLYGTALAPLRELSMDYTQFSVVDQAQSVLLKDLEVMCWPHQQSPTRYVPLSRKVAGLVKHRIVIGHRTVPKALMGTETTHMSRGRDDLLIESVPVRDGRFRGAFNGHYHRQQTVTDNGYEVHIPGSLVRLDSSEADNIPCFFDVTIGGDEGLKVKPVRILNAAKFVVFEHDPTPAEIERLANGSFVRVVNRTVSTSLIEEQLQKAGCTLSTSSPVPRVKTRSDNRDHLTIRAAVESELNKMVTAPEETAEIVEAALVKVGL